MANKRLWMSALALLPAAILTAQKPPESLKTQQDKIRQTLNLPKDPPVVAVGETDRLVFHVSPLSGEGLLSQQTRTALKAILKLNGGAQIVHIRAFSAGNGDVRRIPQIVSDVLGDRRGPLPSVSVIQAGGLALDDAQVVLETVSVGKKAVNKSGLTFYPAEQADGAEAGTPVKALLGTAMDRLAGKMNGQPALAVTCFVSSLEGAQDLLQMATSRFPHAATNLVQPRRLALQNGASCEGVASGGDAGAPRLAFSGTQVAFGVAEKDAAVAVQHLDRALSEAGAPATRNALLLRLYLPDPATAAVALKILAGPAPVSSFQVEGVGPVSAGFAVDAVAPAH